MFKKKEVDYDYKAFEEGIEKTVSWYLNNKERMIHVRS